MDERLTLPNAVAALAKAGGKPFVSLFHHGTLEIEFYRPQKKDDQQPHKRDEVYVIISGEGYFLCDGRRQRFEPGEVLFVAAGIDHRFQEFTPDFAAWVIFFGPDGGERAGNV